MKILAVSGEDSTWLDFAAQLRQRDIYLEVFPNCKMAFRNLNEDPSWDMVILNAGVADECGLRVLRSIKGDSHLSWIPVLIVGSSFAEENIAEYARLGAQDIISLPVVEATLSGKLATAKKCGKRTVLVVDDEDVIGELICEFLHYQRFNTLQASSAEEALEILESATVHLVVSDIVMPGMSGTDLLVKIKDSYPNIPVILITGFGGRVTPEDAVEFGADGYFAKPFKNLELAYTIRRVLQMYGIRPGMATPPGHASRTEESKAAIG